MRQTAGKPYPLGASVDASGVNFALFSAHATSVVLCLFDASGEREVARYPLQQKTHHVWHTHLQSEDKALIYGYRVDGPFAPQDGHRFNANKLLLDPYAKSWVGQFIEHPSHYSGESAPALSADDFYHADNAAYLPKCQVVDVAALVKSAPISHIAQRHNSADDLTGHIIYELHVKGFTQQCEALEAAKRGTYLGLADPNIVQYLTALGITCVELLPVHAFISEAFLQEKTLTNYWGYNSLSFFVPHEGYACQASWAPKAISQFRQMVDTLHQAGISVLLDVVFNHTAEGGHLGPTLCYKGIDNLSYYRLNPDDKRFYINDSGCGNTLNINHPRVLQLVMDALRYWVEVMGVDGFRFDLASSLGREPHGFDPGAGFFDAIAQDPQLSRVILIAEPWDLGPGGYQLGGYPQAWGEWNDRFRDTVRRFWRGDLGMLPELARRLHGSSDLFEHADKGADASVNFVTSHDGFSLHDLVSYTCRHNELNGEQNRDGHTENYSHNYGEEGHSDNKELTALRQRQTRNILTTLCLSQGVPMLLAGDEIGHSQQGNNNAYCQDNAISWRDWSHTEAQQSLLHFVQTLITIRQRFSALYPRSFIHQPATHEGAGLSWFCRDGNPMSKALWRDEHARSLSLVLSGAKDASTNHSQALLLMLNADEQPLFFTPPALEGFSAWHCVLHTQSADFEHAQAAQPADVHPVNSGYVLQDRSLMLFSAQSKGMTHDHTSQAH
ncbi:glycogen debranching protein GlgX [Shewanella sp.]|nr:glycogen debranching protein GlgX [Shewanella sp.]